MGNTQMMNLKTLSMIALSAAFACGCSDGGTSPTNTGGSTGTGGSGNGGTGNTGGGNVGGGGAAAVGNVCPSGVTGIPDCWVSTQNVPGIRGVYAFGDTVTTMRVTEESSGVICVEGVLAQQCDTACPNRDYEYWGGGIGMQLSTGETDPHTPWNAAVAGVTGLNFNVEFPMPPSPSAGIRAQVSLVTDTAHGFVYGGDTAIAAAGPISAQFTEFVQPSWGLATLLWDPTQVDALQFQAVTQSLSSEPYKFCISGIQFIDAAGTVINVPPQPDGAGGGGGATP
jgi:hypothetical protein